MDLIEIFNKKKRDDLWSKYHVEMKHNFKIALVQLYAMIVEHAHEICDNQINGWEKNTCGNRGVGFNNGYASGIKTKDSTIRGSKKVYDHVIGTLECGRYVHRTFVEHNYDYDYMVNEWLYENLYLWSTVRMTSEEHSSANVIRDSNTIEEKIKFQHYINVSELIY